MRCLFLTLVWFVLGVPLAPAAWESEFAGFASEDLANPPPADVIIFTGSSSIRGWPDLPGTFPAFPVRNRGFGGSVMTDVVARFDDLVTRYEPALVVLYEGDNDLSAGLTPAQVFSSYETFVNRVLTEHPGTDTAILAVKPSPSRAALLGAMAELNALLQALCDTSPRLRFIDVYTPMLNASGQPRAELFQSDMLHMNATGYQIWNALVEPVLAAVPFTRGNAVLIDFGSAASTTATGAAPDDPVNRWNNVSAEAAADPGIALSGLITADGVTSGAGLEILDRFNAANEAGTIAATLFPASATRDSLFGNTALFNELSGITPRFRLSGLDAAHAYTLTFYASRTGGTSVRETVYTVTGATTAAAALNAADNIDAVAVVADIHPTAAGELTVALTAGPGNTTPEKFTYLGALMIQSTAPPPPDTTAPEISSAISQADGTLLLTFSEALDPAAAGTASAWAVSSTSGPVSVTAAAVNPDGRSASLTLANPVTGTVTVSVTGVTDLAGNAFAAGTTVNIVIPDRTKQAFLFDFGGTAITTDPANTWNNPTAAATSDTGIVNGLLTTAGEVTSVSLRMVRRFNGTNTNGTTLSTLYPTTATGDTLYGNTELFSGLTNIFPAFRLTGLATTQPLDITFYASRTGVSDNRSTLYSLAGKSNASAVLNPSNNIDSTVTVHNFRPDASGEILIEISPHASNSNSNHFTYLGVLQITPSTPLAFLSSTMAGDFIQLNWSGYGALEWAADPAGLWAPVLPVPAPPWQESVSGLTRRFYRVRERIP